jgi:hypothetical protein
MPYKGDPYQQMVLLGDRFTMYKIKKLENIVASGNFVKRNPNSKEYCNQ